MSRLLLCFMLISSLAGARPRDPNRPKICIIPNLLVRTETVPRTADFTLGAEAFDRATLDYNNRRYAQAARGFLTASAHFAEAGAEGNFKYAFYNAGKAYETAGQAVQGKAAFEAAAAKDKAHAEVLQLAGTALTNRPCL